MCAAALSAARLCAGSTCGNMEMTWWRGWVCFPGGQGVAGSNPAVPTQVKGWFPASATSFWLQWERTCAPIGDADQAKPCVLPYKNADQRLPAISGPACWSAPSPPTRVSFPSGQGVAGSDPGRQRLVLGNSPGTGSVGQRLPPLPAWVLAVLLRRAPGLRARVFVGGSPRYFGCQAFTAPTLDTGQRAAAAARLWGRAVIHRTAGRVRTDTACRRLPGGPAGNFRRPERSPPPTAREPAASTGLVLLGQSRHSRD